MAEERLDGLFATITNDAKGIDGLLDAFFGFLARRTDFFSSSQGKDVIDSQFTKWKIRAEKKAATQMKDMHDNVKSDKTNSGAPKSHLKATSHPKVEEVVEDEAPSAKKPASEAKSSAEEKDAAPVGNGGKTDDAVDVYIPLATPVKSASQCKVVITATNFKLTVAGKPLLDKKFSERVKPGDTFWMLEDSKVVHLVVEKADGMHWWSCVFEGDAEIDTKKIQPENSKLGDLDPELRQTVEKMMFDQEQKARGLPTSDQLKQAQILEQFKLQHPEMDFSQAKINWGGNNSSFLGNV